MNCPQDGCIGFGRTVNRVVVCAHWCGSRCIGAYSHVLVVFVHCCCLCCSSCCCVACFSEQAERQLKNSLTASCVRTKTGMNKTCLVRSTLESNVELDWVGKCARKKTQRNRHLIWVLSIGKERQDPKHRPSSSSQSEPIVLSVWFGMSGSLSSQGRTIEVSAVLESA